MIFIDYYDVIRKKLEVEKAQEIMKRIRKQPRLVPEEYKATKDSMEIERVELAEDKTLRMYVKDGKEPIRMYPDIQSVWFIAYYKRFIPLMIHSLSGMSLPKKIITLLAIKYNFHILPKWFEHIFSTYQPTLKDENYSQPVKEVRRVLKGKLDDSLLDALILILEYDSGYRYRFQDVMMELNKENLTNPAKEIIRLIDILTFRDYGEDIESAEKSKWGRMKKLIRLVFIFCPKIKKQIVAILRDINIDEIKFSKEDIYWTNKNPSYLFRGIAFEDRLKENIKNYGVIK